MSTQAEAKPEAAQSPTEAVQPADVQLSGIRKTYGDVVAVDRIDLQIARGEFFTMLGPSGSGKTTTLRLIAGFERPDEGRVHLRGQDVTDDPPYSRPVNTVFQDYALFPHMNVLENVEYGLKVTGVRKPERTSRAQDALALDAAAHRQPEALRVDRRDVEMREQVVQAGRSDRVAEGLERQPVVAGRELELLEADLHRSLVSLLVLSLQFNG